MCPFHLESVYNFTSFWEEHTCAWYKRQNSSLISNVKHCTSQLPDWGGLHMKWLHLSVANHMVGGSNQSLLWATVSGVVEGATDMVQAFIGYTLKLELKSIWAYFSAHAYFSVATPKNWHSTRQAFMGGATKTWCFGGGPGNSHLTPILTRQDASQWYRWVAC